MVFSIFERSECVRIQYGRTDLEASSAPEHLDFDYLFGPKYYLTFFEIYPVSFFALLRVLEPQHSNDLCG